MDKQSYKVIIRRFYKWLYGTKDYPAIVEWINSRINKAETKLPDEGDLLNEDDIKKLLSSVSHPGDKALISVLWESGARVSEIGNLKQSCSIFLIVSQTSLEFFISI